MALEIGGGNAIQPLMAAAHLGLPVVDADTMGRAYPEAQMTSVAVGDLRPYPCVLYDPRGIEVVVSKVPSWKWMERVSRKICVELGSIASTCKAPRTGREVKEWGILFTVTKAIAIGRRVREAQRRHEDPIAAILDEASGKLLFRGKVVDVARRTTEGFLRGRAAIDGLDEDRGSRLEIAFQNEWVVAWRDGAPLAMSPDLICVLDTRLWRGLRHRDDRLWPARVGHCAPRSAGVPDAERARACRPARLRLRSRLPFGVRRQRVAMRRIGIDVGGTNTDAVLLEDGQVVHAVKTPTTADVTAGIVTALTEVADHPEVARGAIDGVMIGTTHFVNAVLQRRDLARVAAVRIGLPASASLPPFCDWPADLAEFGPRRSVYARRRARLRRPADRAV